jgi:hypothetical protein
VSHRATYAAQRYPSIFGTPASTNLLVTIAVNEPIRQFQVADLCSIDPDKVSKRIERLERIGLVARFPRDLGPPRAYGELSNGILTLASHILADEVRDVLLAIDKWRPARRSQRANTALKPASNHNTKVDMDRLFGAPVRTRVLLYLYIAGRLSTRMLSALVDVRFTNLSAKTLPSLVKSRMVANLEDIDWPLGTFEPNVAFEAYGPLLRLLEKMVTLNPSYVGKVAAAKMMREDRAHRYRGLIGRNRDSNPT